MSCKVEGCNRPVYHYNPLVSPLLIFHGKIVTLGSELPRDGKAVEVVKRIGFAVISPFAYLALAFVALAGLILNGIWENRHVSQGNVMNQKGADLLLATKSTQEEIEVSDIKFAEVGKACQIPPGAFGKEEWEKTFPVTIGEVPPLPLDIEKILEQEDPCEPGKKLKETCQLFLRPQKVILKEKGSEKELPLSFDGVEELAKKATNPDRRTKYAATSDELRSQMNQMPVAEAGWVLMRKEVIPGSRNKSFEKQQQLLKGCFAAPKMMEAILLNIITYASEGKHLYGSKPWTYTRCQEKFYNYWTFVGGFDSYELFVHNHDFGNDAFGLGGVWKY